MYAGGKQTITGAPKEKLVCSLELAIHKVTVEEGNQSTMRISPITAMQDTLINLYPSLYTYICECM